MTNFECKIVKIESKENHPSDEKKTLYHLGEYSYITKKLKDGTDKYNVDDMVVCIPKGAVIPEWLLKSMDLWSTKDKGSLSGEKGDYYKGKKVKGLTSDCLIYPCETYMEHYNRDIDNSEQMGFTKDTKFVFNESGEYSKFIEAKLGEDVAEFLGVKEYEK